MFPIYLDIKNSVLKTPHTDKKTFNRLLKEGLKLTAWFWFSNYAPLHFERIGYSRYPGAYAKTKRRGRPMYESGNLRRNMIERTPTLSGTAKAPTLMMRTGRPVQYEGKKRTDVVLKFWGRQRKKGIYYKNFQEADAAVWQISGYSPENRKAFQNQMAVVNEAEYKSMMAFLQEYILNGMSKAEAPVWNEADMGNFE